MANKYLSEEIIPSLKQKISEAKYVLPTASEEVKGGVKVGEHLEMENEALTIDESVVLSLGDAEGSVSDFGSALEELRNQIAKIPTPYGKVYYRESADGERKVAYIQNEKEFAQLSMNSTSAKITLDNGKVTLSPTTYPAIVHFEFGFMPVTLPTNFLGYCSHLEEEIVIPETVTLGTYFLYNTNYNFPINLPSNTKTIPSAFLYQSEFNQPLSIPEGVTEISDYFLFRCNAMTSECRIPKTVEKIGNCFMAARTGDYDNRSGTLNAKIIFADNSQLKTIGTWFLGGQASFDQPLTIPESVTSIGQYFLGYCSGFNSPITLPDSLTTIPQGFMSWCTSFNQPFKLPVLITELRSCCNSWNSFNQPLLLPSKLTVIWSAFTYVNNLTSTVTVMGQIDKAASGSVTPRAFCGQNANQPHYIEGTPVNGPGADSFIESFGNSSTTYTNFSKVEDPDWPDYGTVYYKETAEGETKSVKILQKSEWDSLFYTNANNHSSMLGYGEAIVNNAEYPAIVGIEIGTEAAELGDGFLRGCLYLNQPVVVPENIKTIGEYFLAGCTSLNQPVTINAPIDTIPRYFMDGVTSFNQPIVIPPTVKTIRGYFMRNWKSFNQPITIPATVTEILAYFMYGCSNMLSAVTIEASADAFTFGIYGMATTVATDACYTQGIKITGPNAAEVKAILADRTTSPYRKLILQ